MKKKDGKILTENSETREIWRQICEVLVNVGRSPEVTARPAGILKVFKKWVRGGACIALLYKISIFS